MKSTNSLDYQNVPRPVAVMAKAFTDGANTGRHHHARAQLLYAASGLMTATTANGAWVVPSGYGLLIPPGLEHAVEMHGAVYMRTAYLAPGAMPAEGSRCRVLAVSALLDAALSALAELPMLYEEAGRGGHLAALILDEIVSAPETPLTAPIPIDPRLRRICEALIGDPADSRDLDDWAAEAGMSRKTLTRKFRDETGLSFGIWRERVRRLAAMARIASGNPASKVAVAVGYSDARTLRVMMRRVTRVAA